MRKLIVLAFVGCFGCLSEKNSDPGVPSTFVKYFNGGYNDTAQDIKATSDGGYILLATSEVRPNEVTEARFKIKLIKTDAYGNPIWQQVYPPYDPDFTTQSPTDSSSFKGRALEVLKDGAGMDAGYVIVGDSIQKGIASQSHLRIMVTDLDGNVTSAKNFKPSFAIQGKGVAINSTGNFIVLGAAVNSLSNNNMFLAELDQNLNIQWMQSYGAGASNLANKLFIDDQESIFWSGTVTKNNRSDVRFVKTPPNSANTAFDLPIGNPDNNETGNDICSYGFGFAVIGSTDESGDDDILFKRLAPDGSELASKSYGFPNQAENGLAICQAKDGGLLLLGNVDTNVEAGRGGKDYFLVKINAFGDTEWTRIFGSKNDDIGASLIANSDGSYTILGTTIFGGLRTLALIKTDKQGRIE